MLLADGMGGHEYGSVASKAAVKVIRDNFLKKPLCSKLEDEAIINDLDLEVNYLTLVVNDAVDQANSFIYERNQLARIQQYMGTTLVGMILGPKSKQVVWFHVGDSRLYRFRDSVLKCMTIDHSAYEEWLRNGKLGKRPGKNLITRAVGTRDSVIVDIGWDKKEKGDIYILCSDGLNDMLSDKQIADMLKSGDEVNVISQKMIDAANEAGGRDNVSVVLCKA